MKAISVLSRDEVDAGTHAVTDALQALNDTDPVKALDLVVDVAWYEVNDKDEYLKRCALLWDANEERIKQFQEKEDRELQAGR